MNDEQEKLLEVMVTNLFQKAQTIYNKDSYTDTEKWINDIRINVKRLVNEMLLEKELDNNKDEILGIKEILHHRIDNLCEHLKKESQVK